MSTLNNKTRVILIGGTSHIGKSTLAKSLATKLGWEYLATDNLARHPGRPWTTTNNPTIKQHVIDHYRNLAAPVLLSDVLKHYVENILPQVKAVIEAHRSDLSNKLIIEGSALYPSLVKELVDRVDVQGIWLAGNHRLVKNRIYENSNFYHIGKEEQYLIHKFIERTWLYNQAMLNELKNLDYICIQVNSKTTIEELMNKCLRVITS